MSLDVTAIMEAQIAEAKKIYIEDGFIVLNFLYPYEIELSRCSTPGKILGWVNQLSEKTWMNAERLNHFVRLAFKQIGIETNYI